MIFLKELEAEANNYNEIISDKVLILIQELRRCVEALESEQEDHSGPHSEGWTCAVCDALAELKKKVEL